MSIKSFLFFLLILLLGTSLQHVQGQVLKNDTRITIDPDGTKTTVRTVLIQVNDKQENWLSHVEIRHSPDEDFSLDYARVIDSRGEQQQKLRKRDLSTRSILSYEAFYQDDLATEFDLYWHQYPYQIEYSYSIKEEEFIYVAWWTPVLFTNVPTLNASLEINVPLEYDIHIDSAKTLEYNKSLGEQGIKHHWRTFLIGKTSKEIYSPPIKERLPKVAVVPSQFTYGVPGSSDTWSSFGAWLEELNAGTDKLPAREKYVVEHLTRGLVDKKEIIKKLYYHLQDHTRYINVAIDVGGLKSYPASYVCKNKYGDCKALTTYMKSMLRSMGIKSLYTVIHGGQDKITISKDFPSQQFNHVVLAVPIENDTIWLENTSTVLPFDYLGTFTQDRAALAVNGEKSSLVKTPALQPADVLVQRNFEFRDDEKGDWQSSTILTLRGSAFEDFRYAMSDNDEETIRSEIMANLNLRKFKLDSWQRLMAHRDSTYVRLKVKGKVPNPIREIGDWKVIRPLRISLPEFEDPQNRKLPVRIPYPINKSDQVTYSLAQLSEKEIQLPEGIRLESSYGLYTTEYKRNGDSVIVHEQFTLKSNDIPVNTYPDFYSFLASIIEHKKKSAILIL